MCVFVSDQGSRQLQCINDSIKHVATSPTPIPPPLTSASATKRLMFDDGSGTSTQNAPAAAHIK